MALSVVAYAAVHSLDSESADYEDLAGSPASGKSTNDGVDQGTQGSEVIQPGVPSDEFASLSGQCEF